MALTIWSLSQNGIDNLESIRVCAYVCTVLLTLCSRSDVVLTGELKFRCHKMSVYVPLCALHDPVENTFRQFGILIFSVNVSVVLHCCPLWHGVMYLCVFVFMFVGERVLFLVGLWCAGHTCAHLQTPM